MRHFRETTLVCYRCDGPADPSEECVVQILGEHLCSECAQDIADEWDGCEAVDVNGDYDD